VLIDWFTVAAQIVNFLILMALLKYFLYDRVVKAMDEREEKIHSRLQQAESLRQEAEREREVYRHKNREIDRKRDEVLARVEVEAARRREEALQEAREEIDRLRSGWREALHREQESFLRRLRLTAAGQVMAVSRRVLADLADAGIEKKVVDAFLRRLEGMDSDERQEAVDAIMKEGGLVVLRSAGALSPAERRKISAVLRRVLGEGIKVEYETVPEMVLGVELVSRGQKIAWNLEEYLTHLETGVREILEAETESRDRKSGEPASGGDGTP